jgi:hypothetical protein
LTVLTKSIACRPSIEASDDESDGASDDENDRNASPVSSIHSYASNLTKAPLQALGPTMKHFPRAAADLPLILVLHAADLFLNEQIQTHGLHDVSWTLNFSTFPNHALNGIKAHIAKKKRKIRQASKSDGDNSRSYGVRALRIWRPKKQRTQRDA